MDRVETPDIQSLEHWENQLQSFQGVFQGSLHLLVDVELAGILGKGINKVHLWGDVQQGVAPGLDQRRDQCEVNGGGFDCFAEIGLRRFEKGIGT
ncbi:hypothetical protein SDC9_68302 [bioreactor metagenome]|uniref:Uncharacterized protein n=1 Tax=bioreactor metagenome TaxID=1076179 RepID=A0A644Y004_9ZZZZ